MDIADEIAARVAKMSAEMQARVLWFVSSLLPPKGESGELLRQFSGVIDPISAQEMTYAIEDECERIDAGVPKTLPLCNDSRREDLSSLPILTSHVNMDC
jgi:hypothetical protein